MSERDVGGIDMPLPTLLSPITGEMARSAARGTACRPRGHGTFVNFVNERISDI